MGQTIKHIEVPQTKSGVLKMQCNYKIITTVCHLTYPHTIHYLFYSAMESASLCDVEYVILLSGQEIPDGYVFVGNFGTDLLYLKTY